MGFDSGEFICYNSIFEYIRIIISKVMDNLFSDATFFFLLMHNDSFFSIS